MMAAAELGESIRGENIVTCRDGFRFSVIAGDGAYCQPRPGWGPVPEDYPGPFFEVECGFWHGRLPKPAKDWRPYLDTGSGGWKRTIVGGVTVYPFTPVRLVYELIRRHGGEIPTVGAPAWTPERMARLVRNRERPVLALRAMADELTRAAP